MRFRFFILILTLALGRGVSLHGAQQPSPSPPPSRSPSPPLETEGVSPSGVHPSSSGAEPTEADYLEPARVQALLHKVWLSEFRLQDLLSQVRPERWELPDAARDSFSKTLETLRAQLEALEAWRGQFDQRTDSMYLAYETYTAIDAVLPRLDGVARSVSVHENASLGAQYAQAGNQLFDLEQALRPHLGYLLRNQDQLLLAAQNNLAVCENHLGLAMRELNPPRPIPSTVTQGPARRRPSRRGAGGGHTPNPEK